MRPSTPPDDGGTVKITNEVIGRIAAIAAKEVPGVVGVRQGIPVGSAMLFGGVKVKTQDRDLRIGVPLIVEYGVNLPRVAIQVQERVRAAVHRMTDIAAIDVDVSVHGVREPKEARS